MMANERYGIPGYFACVDLPQRPIVPISTTGWLRLDEIFRPYAGQLVVVTGRTNHGKSTFLLNLLTLWAQRDGIKSIVYVPENEGALYERLELLWRGNADGFQHFVTEQCFVQSSKPEHYDDQVHTLHTLHWMLDRAERVIERDHVECLLIDPWNQLERVKPRDQLLTDYINDCLFDLAQFARSFGITAIIVAHPTKAMQEVPTLYDIEGSAAWANKCDNGLVVHRKKDHTTQVISEKVRESPKAGTWGTADFFVDPITGRFTPLMLGPEL